MTKARTLGNFVSAGNPLADGTIAAAEVTGLATVATSGAYADLSGKPSLATVATSGAYADLSGKPTLATVATSGSYNDLSDKPNITATANDLSGGATGSIPYQANTGDTTMLAAGSAGKVLTMNGGVPVWADAPTPGVTSVGSIVRKSGVQFYLATPANTILTAGYIPNNGSHMSGTAILNLSYPRYSTYYGAWVAYEASTYLCYMSKDGLNWTPIFTKPSTFSSNPPLDGASIYVVDDSNGYIFCFGVDLNTAQISFWYKTSITSTSWTGPTVILSDTTSRNLHTVDFVWFGSVATSGFIICASNSTTSFVLKIPAGTQTVSTVIQSSNSNGQAMAMDWNATAGLVVVINRAPSASHYAIMYSLGGDISLGWVGVTQTTCGFDPGSNAGSYKPVVSPTGSVMWSSMPTGSYYYRASGSLNGTWSNTTAGSNQVLYYGHNGTSWYMAKGQTGAISTVAGYLSSFHTSSSSTPSSLSAVSEFPFLPLDNQSVYLSGLWTQRKY